MLVFGRTYLLGFAHRIDHIKLDEHTTRKTCCQGCVSRPLNLLFISCFLENSLIQNSRTRAVNIYTTQDN